MTQELIYTSAPKGLRLGSRGFCTVACTPGMAKPLADRLEALSGYKHLFPPGSEQAALNPVNYSYVTFKLGGKTYYVLSRIADAGLDYTQRTNKLAHHVVLEASELTAAGPAWLMSQPGFFVTKWEGEPRIIERGRALPRGELHSAVCHAWEIAAGDAGWGGVLAESVESEGRNEAYVIYPPGTNALELLVEAQGVLEPPKRWAATFSSYFTVLPPGTDCRWRLVPGDTPEAIRARRAAGVPVIDFGQPTVSVPDGPMAIAARTGIMPPKAPLSHEILRHGSPNAVDPQPPVRIDVTERPTIDLAPSPPLLPKSLPASQKVIIDRPIARKFSWIAVLGVIFLLLAGMASVLFVLDFNPPQLTVDVGTSTPASRRHLQSKTPPATDLPPEPNSLDSPPSASPASAGEGASGRGVDQGQSQGAGPAPPPTGVPQTPSTETAPGVPVPNANSRSSLPPTLVDPFAKLERAIYVPYVAWGSRLGEWSKPVSIGPLTGDDKKLHIKLHGTGDHRITVTGESPTWSLTDDRNNVVAELRLEREPENASLSFIWNESAVNAPRGEVAAISWSCLELKSSQENVDGPLCYVTLSPERSRRNKDTPLQFNNNLQDIEREFIAPAAQDLVATYRVDVGGDPGKSELRKIGDQYQCLVGEAYPVAIDIQSTRAAISGDSEQVKVQLKVQVRATTPTGEESMPLAAAIKEESGKNFRRVLVEAIEHYSSLAANTSGLPPGETIIEGLMVHHPDKVGTRRDYRRVLHQLTLGDLEDFAETARHSIHPVPPLFEKIAHHKDRITAWRHAAKAIEKDIKVNMRVARQIRTGEGPEDRTEAEIYRAGQL